MATRVESTVTSGGWTVRRAVTDGGLLVGMRLIPPPVFVESRDAARIRGFIRAARAR